MLKKLLLGYFSFIVTTHAMEVIPTQEICTQKDLNQFSTQISEENYRQINTHVTFAEKPSTDSQFWETQTVLAIPYFVKIRGVLLSEALNDLINGNSLTSFECTTASCINTWKIFLAFSLSIDRTIAEIEAKHADFFFPLMMPVVLQGHQQYALYYGFHMRDVPFKIGINSVNTKEEWEKIENLSSWLDRLPIFTAYEAVTQTSQPCKTIEGGLLYLPNAEGIKGIGKGENLFCVNAAQGLYYGFGPNFIDGPKTLFQISMYLQTYALKDNAAQYLAYTKQYCEQLGNNKRNDCHILQYLIKPEYCQYLNLDKMKRQLDIMEKDEVDQSEDELNILEIINAMVALQK